MPDGSVAGWDLAFFSFTFLQLRFCQGVTAVTWLQVPLTKPGPRTGFTPREPIDQNNLLL